MLFFFHFQSSRSHAIFTLYIQQQRQAKSENNPFHLELDEADSENAVKKVNISCPVLSCHHVHLSVHTYVRTNDTTVVKDRVSDRR